jgi:hypothetical protein
MAKIAFLTHLQPFYSPFLLLFSLPEQRQIPTSNSGKVTGNSTGATAAARNKQQRPTKSSSGNKCSISCGRDNTYDTSIDLYTATQQQATVTHQQHYQYHCEMAQRSSATTKSST